MTINFPFILQNYQKFVKLGEFFNDSGNINNTILDFLQNFPIIGYWITIFNYGSIMGILNDFDVKKPSGAMIPISFYQPLNEKLDYLDNDGYYTYMSNKVGVYTGDYSKEQKKDDLISQIDFVFSPRDGDSYNYRYIPFCNVKNIDRLLLSKFYIQGFIKKHDGKHNFADINVNWNDLSDEDTFTIYSLLPLGYDDYCE